MSNVIPFKRPVQVENIQDCDDVETIAQLHLFDNISANLSYISLKDKDELLTQLLAGHQECYYADQLFQEKIDNREEDRQRRAQRKHLRSLIERLADSDGNDLDAFDEFMDAVLDAKNSNIISDSLAIDIENAFRDLGNRIWDFLESSLLPDSVQEKRYNKLIAAQAKLNRYVYYLVR